MTLSDFIKKIRTKKILILGIGVEGKSTYSFLRRHFPRKHLTLIDRAQITDSNILKDKNISIIIDDDFLKYFESFDIIFKSPGIPSKLILTSPFRHRITSQTDVFLEIFKKNTIGITGTKGKSTTSSLIFHILKTLNLDTILVGNIGIPCFDFIEKINENTKVVMELSAHQLEFVKNSPHISVLLNVYPEHLDHFASYDQYLLSKFNIIKFQDKNDFYILNSELDNKDFITKTNSNSNKTIINTDISNRLINKNKNITYIDDNKLFINYLNKKTQLFDFNENINLKGEHNRINIAFAETAAFLISKNCKTISQSIKTFKPLEHRLEFVGNIHNIDWYNDSIATIPQATIQAVKSIPNIETLILGGSDKRNLDYSVLYDFLKISDIKNIIFIGLAGQRMYNEIKTTSINKILCDNFSELIKIAIKCTKKGNACLLSPAASSYDIFKNFEQRGKVYKDLIKNYKK